MTQLIFPKMFIILSIAAFGLAEPLIRTTCAGTVYWKNNTTSLKDATLDRSGTRNCDAYDEAMKIRIMSDGSTFQTIQFFYSNTYSAVIQKVQVKNISESDIIYGIECRGDLGSDRETKWHYVSKEGPGYTVSSDQSGEKSTGNDPVVSMLFGDEQLKKYDSDLEIQNGEDKYAFRIHDIKLRKGERHQFVFMGCIGNIDDNEDNRPDLALDAVRHLCNINHWPADLKTNILNDHGERLVNWNSDKLRRKPSVNLTEMSPCSSVKN